MRATADEARADIKLGLHFWVFSGGKVDHRQWCVFCHRTFEKGEGYYRSSSDGQPKKRRPAGSHKRWYACNECFKKVKP